MPGIEKLKESALWMVGAEGASNTSIYEFDWDRDVALVVGSEDKGLSRVVKDRCDHLVSIPRVGHMSSLNVSIACGIILSETVRQRGNPK